MGFVHGKMSGDDKSKAIEEFANGEVPVLVSTTVIEVGMDISEASFMIVNNAERFGLAQLHQLRGRVGRGQRPSRCILLTKGEWNTKNHESILGMMHHLASMSILTALFNICIARKTSNKRTKCVYTTNLLLLVLCILSLCQGPADEKYPVSQTVALS